MVSDYTKLVKNLASKVYEILRASPVDVVEDDGTAVYECLVWELISPREDGTICIGSANLMLANNVVIKFVHELKDRTPFETGQLIFKSVLTTLEADKLIRQSPLLKRKGFKVITNDREKS